MLKKLKNTKKEEQRKMDQLVLKTMVKMKKKSKKY
jgi:hypothetical protein